MTNTAKKKVFISDIHMGDARSMKGTPLPDSWFKKLKNLLYKQPPYSYSWFNKNIPFLAEFLKKQLEDPDVEEVVILGDLFDTWVIPVDKDPLPDFQAIVACKKNQKVITALKDLATKHKLTYIPGNHDMAVSDSGTNPEIYGDHLPWDQI